MSESTLYMTRLELETRRLFVLGRRRRLPARSSDLGYLVHCALGELFGEEAPAPFAVTGQDRRFTQLLAYGEHPRERLRELAERFAMPELFALCRWEDVQSKPMPSTWPTGTRVGFEVRVCPVIRGPKHGPNHGSLDRKNSEVDAFLAECWRVGSEEDVSRETVYRAWLERQLVRSEGARLLEARMERFQLTELMRRTQGSERKARVKRKPDVTLQGTLEVTAAEPFVRLLRRGVGRHRAFGFGMLMLRR